MLRNKIDKGLYNPAFGLFPILLFIYLIVILPLHFSLDLSLAVCTFMFVGFIWLIGKRVFQSFILISMLTLLFFNVVIQLFGESFISSNAIVILELLFFVILLITKIFETKIHKFVDDNLKIAIKINLKPTLQMYFFVTKLFLVFIPIHLILLVLVRNVFHIYLTDSSIFWIREIFPIFILFVGLIEFLNIRWIGSRIKMERYLPIIDSNSRVIGHIALSESESFEKKFLHPMIRIVFKYDKKLYLKERPLSYKTEVGKVCLPIEDYMNYGETIDQALKRITQHYFGKAKIVPRFLLKYAHDEETRKSLNYLYLINLNNEKSLHVKNIKGGKWWTEKQIEDNIGKGYFSTCFESEFDYIQCTVLMADRYENVGDIK